MGEIVVENPMKVVVWGWKTSQMVGSPPSTDLEVPKTATGLIGGANGEKHLSFPTGNMPFFTAKKDQQIKQHSAQNILNRIGR